MHKPHNTFLFFALCLFSIAGVAGAQAIDPLRFVISPETPGPGQEVRMEAQGVGGFLGEATITWRLNGALVLSGVGERVFTFATGALGSRSTVNVSINSPTQGSIAREFAFIPSLVNLVWEADTYTPPFFRGKALYTPGSPLKVVAYPTVITGGSQAAISGLSFQWSRNDEPVPQASGLGRNTFSFVGDQLQVEERVSVDIFAGAARVARGGIAIPASEPLVLLYNRDPLRGVVYEQAFPQAVSLSGREITVQAEPYYFSNASKDGGALSYAWEINGVETTGPDAARGLLTLRQEGSGAGEAVLAVAAQNENPDQLLQRAAAVARIVFGQQAAATADPFASGLSAAAAAWNRLAQAQVTVNALPQAQYVPLEPLLPRAASDSDNQFTRYLQVFFRLLIIGGGIFAVLMLTVGGITYMISEVPGVKLDALDRAKAALLGLLLIGASWLILNAINPNLLNFDLILKNVGPVLAPQSAQQSVSGYAGMTDQQRQNTYNKEYCNNVENQLSQIPSQMRDLHRKYTYDGQPPSCTSTLIQNKGLQNFTAECQKLQRDLNNYQRELVFCRTEAERR